MQSSGTQFAICGNLCSLSTALSKLQACILCRSRTPVQSKSAEECVSYSALHRQWEPQVTWETGELMCEHTQTCARACMHTHMHTSACTLDKHASHHTMSQRQSASTAGRCMITAVPLIKASLKPRKPNLFCLSCLLCCRGTPHHVPKLGFSRSSVPASLHAIERPPMQVW